eukprot:NODE_4202_length_1101_cov_86.288344_g4004_i0.p1 GENE.NODE_4202_length_1101_cov_86.288344_g4004_i0~~NODE_4202_length_1101_cov_86.288344_g4004_i0.p1  ORF type:complete len:252 (+),score=47.88 NODE_4202_length_1101_cov_86.288344_g4004_i0:235-990(+)
MDGMVMEGATLEEARARFYVISSVGLLGKKGGGLGDQNHSRPMADDRVPWVRTDLADSMPLLDVVKAAKATVLLGLSTTPGIFTEEVVKACAANTDQPIIFPMSNPTSKSECTAEDAYRWTNGRCIFASGSPFDPVTVGDRTFHPSQCNNMYIFPGVGLGGSIVKARRITDRMFYRVAEALADSVTPEQRAAGLTFPSIDEIRACSRLVCRTIVEEALDAGLARIPRPDNIDDFVDSHIYHPEYSPIISHK